MSQNDAPPGPQDTVVCGEGPWDLGPGLPRGTPEKGSDSRRRPPQAGGPSK